MDDDTGDRQAKRLEENVTIAKRLGMIKRKIVVMSGKGGVGKTTVAVNLAFALSQRGKKVGLLDVDINGPNVPKMLGIEDEKLSGSDGHIEPVPVSKNLKVVSMAFLLQSRDTPVIWRGPMKMQAIRQFLGEVEWGELDYLVADLPPGTGDEPLSIAQLIREGANAIIVTTPQDVALLDSRKSVNFARALKMEILGIVENMSGLSCPHCGTRIDLFKVGGGESAAGELGIPFLGRIPIDPAIVETGDSGEPFVVRYPDSASAVAFGEIVDGIDPAGK